MPHPTTVHGLFIEHQQLARLWIVHQSPKGQSSERKELRMMYRFSVSELRSLLLRHNVRIPR